MPQQGAVFGGFDRACLGTCVYVQPSSCSHLFIFAVCLFPTQNGLLKLLLQGNDTLIVIYATVLQYFPASIRRDE